MSSIEFIPRPQSGRTFSNHRKIRLADTGPNGLLRVDGAARFLQDVATDDWEDSGIDPGSTWVVRRTALRVALDGRWPRLSETIEVTTWCGGYGAAWAERRTDFSIDGATLIEAAALWVPINRQGKPQRVSSNFLAVYGEACDGRKVPGRIPTPELPTTAEVRPWTLRQSDLDIVGHVNNAALWAPVVEASPEPLTFATLTHHGSVEASDEVVWASAENEMWLVVNGDVRVTAVYESR